MDNKHHSTSVIIVGAGMSGISAAKVLVESGVSNIKILEADNRIGGRIKKEDFCGFPVELGASWISGVGGADSNPIWEFANMYNLRTCFTDASTSRYNIYEATRRGKAIADEQYKNSVNSALEKLKKNPKPKRNTTVVEQSSDGKTSTELAIEFLLHEFEIPDVYPTPTFEQFGKKEYLVADEKGYEHLVYRLAESFLYTSEDGQILDARLSLNKVVQEVQHSGSSVSVRTKDGCIYEADYIIITVNIGVLQNDLIEFTPALPVWKREAIARCDIKVFTKIFLKFPYRFWPCGQGSDFFIHAHEMKGYYTFWQHMENVYPGSNILVVILTNEESKRIEAQVDEETQEEIMEVLRSMFGNDIPTPVDILVPRWWNNQFQRGSYSNYPIHGSSQLINAIKAPIGKVFFSGEHTSENFSGYVHGAYLAGTETSMSILAKVRLENKLKINDHIHEEENLTNSLMEMNGAMQILERNVKSIIHSIYNTVIKPHFPINCTENSRGYFIN